MNFLSIDVEDWFHVANYADVISKSEWKTMENRLPKTIYKILDILDDYQVKATFFILGWVAERQRDLVRAIVEKGHEIGSHGYGHDLLYQLGPEKFQEDLLRGLEVLAPVMQDKVLGYRAPSFTLTSQTRWVYSILAKAGIRYDSSVYPLRRRRCGIPDAPMVPHDVDTSFGSIREFPIATGAILGRRIPIGGGGYFRLYPYWVTASMIRRLNRQGIPAVFYIHPWEFDPDQPVPLGAAWNQRWKHRINLKNTEKKFRRLLNDFQFQPLFKGLK